ncbi:hypothetical protein DS742_17470 [Lacrimispora amygdalina]|uniref:Uncharacterized protein n=1 Tax=Lacrimispora amygdalina TaxID=253257 RepID=A0A3E2N9B0_9FIRM|nr:hypothetical protein [Clostridium indicum]RFZ77605.1 hypothetical protein DS742_17470 [Clostridium indicum]
MNPDIQQTSDCFHTFLENRNDDLSNAAFSLLALLHQPSGDRDNPETPEFPWNMALIGPLLDTAEKILQDGSFSSCYPYYEEDIPCYRTNSCHNCDCVFRQTQPVQDDIK